MPENPIYKGLCDALASVNDLITSVVQERCVVPSTPVYKESVSEYIPPIKFNVDNATHARRHPVDNRTGPIVVNGVLMN